MKVIQINRQAPSEQASTHRRQRGFGLVEVVVGAAIISILLMAMVSIQTLQMNENKSLSDKLASVDLNRVLTTALGSSVTCGLMFTKPGNVLAGSLTFNKDTVGYPYIVNLNSVPMSATVDAVSQASPIVSAMSNALKLRAGDGIQMEVSDASGATGFLRITFDQNGLVRPIKSLSFPLSIQSTLAGPLRTLTGCAGSSGGASACVTRSAPAPATVQCLAGETAMGGGVECTGFGTIPGTNYPTTDGWHGEPCGYLNVSTDVASHAYVSGVSIQNTPATVHVRCCK